MLLGNCEVDNEQLLALPLCVPAGEEQTETSSLVTQVIAAATLVDQAATDAEVERVLRIRRKAEERVEAGIASLYGLDPRNREAIDELS